MLVRTQVTPHFDTGLALFLLPVLCNLLQEEPAGGETRAGEDTAD